MSCDICLRSHNAKRLPFLCAVDARNQLYPGRIEWARRLIANEALEMQISNSLVQESSPSGKASEWQTAHILRVKDEIKRCQDETQSTIARATALAEAVAAARHEIQERKAAVSRARKDLHAVSGGLSPRRTRQLDETQHAIKMTRFKWRRDAESMAATRGFLCMETARLSGLRRVKKGSITRYELGDIDLVDIGTMSYTSPETITTSLARVAHIVGLAARYLALRLPAELILPHRDYPRPTIFSLSSSNQHEQVPYPGSVVIPTSQSAEVNRKQLPKPRPLFVDKPLLILAKDDTASYSQFIEAVALLAYNIAWACATQGVSIGDTSSCDDVCNIGRNLYNLLMGSQLVNDPAGRLLQAASQEEDAAKTAASEAIIAGDNLQHRKVMMGRWSHGTAFGHLGGAEGQEMLNHFKLPSPMKLADRLKKRLATEATAMDWDLLDDEAPIEDTAGSRTVLTLETNPKGGHKSNGWTKIRSGSKSFAEPGDGS